jgi:hypothetical protein
MGQATSLGACPGGNIARRFWLRTFRSGGPLDVNLPTPYVPPRYHRDYLMQRLSAPSECRAQALYCRVVADVATDEEVRTLWVSMAQTWTKLAEAMERLQPH